MERTHGSLYLALDQAGAYILETGCDFSTYYKVYQQQRAMLLRERGNLFIGHPESVATTILICFEKIRQLNPAAGDILRFCAILHAETVSEELFTEGTIYFDSTLASVTSDLHAWNKALSILRAYSLVYRNSNENTLTMHRLVKEVLKDEMSEQEQSILATYVVQALNHIFPYHEDEVATWWSLCARYISQVLAGVTLIKQWNIRSPESAQLLTKVDEYYGFISLKARESHVLLTRALSIQEEVLGPDHPDIARTCLRLAILDQMEYARAATLGTPFALLGAAARFTSYENFERALTICEKALGPDHPRVAHVLNSLARCQMGEGDKENAEAEKNFERALAIREKVLGPDHPLTALTLNDMGRFYEEEYGDYKRAEALYRRSIQILKKTPGRDDPTVATVLNNLGLVLKKQGKYEEAEPFYQQALHIREQWYDEDHHEVCQSLDNLAKLYLEQQKYEQAKPLFIRAFQVHKKNYGITGMTIDLLLTSLELVLPQEEFKGIVGLVENTYRQWRSDRLPDSSFQDMLNVLERLLL